MQCLFGYRILLKSCSSNITGEAFDSFIAFASLHKEPLLFPTSGSFSKKTLPAIRRAFFPCVLEAKGKELSPKKKTPDRRLDKTSNFSVYIVFLLEG